MTRTRRLLPLALRVVMASTVGVVALLVGMTHDAPEGGWVAHSAEAYDAAMTRGPANVPTWDDVTPAERVGCEPMRGGIVPADVLVSDRDGNVERLTFDAAWSLVEAHPVGSEDPAYVVGMCRA